MLHLTPKLLTDKSRLQEIYNLRVAAYENSPKAIYVNQTTHPNGWYDKLDERPNTFHWIVEHEDKIVAAARIAILDTIDDLTDVKDALDKYEIPKERPFVYYSRLVVAKPYRKMQLVEKLDAVRVSFIKRQPQIHFAIGWATPDREAALTKLGFKAIGGFEYVFGAGGGQPQSVFLLLNV